MTQLQDYIKFNSFKRMKDRTAGILQKESQIVQDNRLMASQIQEQLKMHVSMREELNEANRLKGLYYNEMVTLLTEKANVGN